jgi:large subunit ribosomal protein L41
MKPTPVLLRRVARHALNTKQANKGFYKGTGSGSMGSHTKYGGYKIDWDKVRTYVVPKDLKDCKVRDYCMSRLARIFADCCAAHAVRDEEDEAD